MSRRKDGRPTAEEEAGDYVSKSSIDSPPKEPKSSAKDDVDPEQQEAMEEEADAYLSGERPVKFEVHLAMKIKGYSDMPADTLNIFKGTLPASSIEEFIQKRMQGDYFLQKLRGIIGLPEKTPEQEELEGFDL